MSEKSIHKQRETYRFDIWGTTGMHIFSNPDLDLHVISGQKLHKLKEQTSLWLLVNYFTGSSWVKWLYDVGILWFKKKENLMQMFAFVMDFVWRTPAQ